MTWQPIETWLPVYLWGLFSLHSKCTTSIIMASRHHFEACDEESATFPAQRWRWVLRRCKVSCATLMWLEELGRGGDTVLIRLGAGVVKGAIVVVRPYDLLCSWNTGRAYNIYIYVYIDIPSKMDRLSGHGNPIWFVFVGYSPEQLQMISVLFCKDTMKNSSTDASPRNGVWTSRVWMKTIEGRHLRWWDFRKFCVTVSMNGMMVRWYAVFLWNVVFF